MSKLIIAALVTGLILCMCRPAEAQEKPTDAFVWESKIRVVVDSPSRIKDMCSGMRYKKMGPYGCFKVVDGVPTMFVWFRHSRMTLEQYHETMGHELDHMIRGAFH